jgi:hypothetical protein
MPKPKGAVDWALLLGGALLGGYLLKTFVFGGHTAKANFANSSNSIYPVHDTDLGDSMNAIVPTARQKYSTVLPHHHGYHHHAGGAHRSFPDYTDRANALPATFLDHNVPYDSFNIGANLSNVIDKCAYVQTYDGNSFGSP